MPDELWVFGYGSLIWNPGFAVANQQIARLHDWQRSFCMYSIHHRGSVDCPGLVLALDHAPGGHCDGVAFLVEPGAEPATITALRDRELISSAYVERYLPVDLADGRQVRALAFVIDPDHAQYCRGMALDVQARIIADAVGGRGSNRDYLFATVDHLTALGIADAELTALNRLVRAL